MKVYQFASPERDQADSLEKRMRDLTERIERERETLQRAAQPLQDPVQRLERWQHTAERLAAVLPTLLLAAIPVVLALWLSGRWSSAHLRRWVTFATRVWALYSALQESSLVRGVAENLQPDPNRAPP